MKNFLTGLLIGLAVMYWYAYQKDAFVVQAKVWFAKASADPDAEEKIENMTSRRR